MADAAQVARAEDMFAGRTTEALLTAVTKRTPEEWSLVLELDLSARRLRDVALLSRFHAVQQLLLHRNSLREIAPLASCAALVTLDLSFNPLLGAAAVGASLSAAARNLKSLALEATGVTRVDTLQLRLPALMFLNLKHNNIQTLAAGGFEGLPRLQELLLDSNQLRDLPAGCMAASSASLRVISLESNLLTGVDGLAGCRGLRALGLAGNRLADWNVLQCVDAPLEVVTAASNPIARRQGPAYRTALLRRYQSLREIDGAEVTATDMDRAFPPPPPQQSVDGFMGSPDGLTGVAGGATSLFVVSSLRVPVPAPPSGARSGPATGGIAGRSGVTRPRFS
jgi:hypothetical protein